MPDGKVGRPFVFLDEQASVSVTDELKRLVGSFGVSYGPAVRAGSVVDEWPRLADEPLGVQPCSDHEACVRVANAAIDLRVRQMSSALEEVQRMVERGIPRESITIVHEALRVDEGSPHTVVSPWPRIEVEAFG